MRWRLLAATVFLGACARAAPEKPIVIAIPSGPQSVLPYATNEEFTITVLNNAYEALVELDRRLLVAPALAESWYAEDDLTWVFRLRHGVTFHDGVPLTAEHVAWSLRQALSDPASKRRVALAVVTAIETRGTDTVVVRTSAPSGTLANRLANVPVWRAPAQTGQPPIGTGPFRIVSWDPGRDTVLEAYPGHRAGPKTKSLIFRAMPGASDRVAALVNGDVQLAIDVPADAGAALETSGQGHVVSEKGLRVVYLAMDTARATNPDIGAVRNPFVDVRARKALALAIDRAALVEGALGGQAEVVDHVVAPTVFGYDKTLPTFTADVEKARQLLREAGWADGFEATIDYVPGKYRAIDAVVRDLVRQLVAVGIRLRPRPLEAAEFFRRVESRQTAMYLLGWMSTSGDAGLTYDYLLHSPREGRGIENGGGHASAALDQLIEDSAVRLRTQERLPLLQKAARTIQEEMPVVPLYRQTDLYGVSGALDFEPRVDRRLSGLLIRWKPAAH